MRYALRLGLVVFTMACGGSVVAPSLRVEIITDSLSSVGQFAVDYKWYKVSPGQPGFLTASIQWDGDRQLWMFLFDEEPPSGREPITHTDQARIRNPDAMSARVVAGTYWVLVTQQQYILGPDQGSCRCVNNFVLTLSIP